MFLNGEMGGLQGREYLSSLLSQDVQINKPEPYAIPITATDMSAYVQPYERKDPLQNLMALKQITGGGGGGKAPFGGGGEQASGGGSPYGTDNAFGGIADAYENTYGVGGVG